jgi:hypothetical protein
MTVVRLGERLARLERRGTGWKAWENVPVYQWPDAALWAFLGFPANVDLQRIIDTAPKGNEVRS